MKRNKYVIELTSKEQRLCLEAMINFRNSVLAQGIDTADIDKLIKLLSKM